MSNMNNWHEISRRNFNIAKLIRFIGDRKSRLSQEDNHAWFMKLNGSDLIEITEVLCILLIETESIPTTLKKEMPAIRRLVFDTRHIQSSRCAAFFQRGGGIIFACERQ